ncbi:hypothetical protein K501DRAFT_327242 [Backusella circina FSU 941]|nr:hypothetical protein K501DRAFT_327242 [Backusella circina FSU 941]
MALKFELEQWQTACTAFDNKEYRSSLKTFMNIADNAKMYFNIGLIFTTEEEYDHALAAYTKSITMDPYFAVAYFQRGVTHFIRNNMEAAIQDFEQTYQKLRGNQIINYQQLGLSFRLYACEVLFNRGICQLYLGKMDAGLTDLYHAQKAKMTEEHDVIDLAVKDRGKGYSVFSIPPFVLFRPPENRLRQLQGVDMFSVVDQLPAAQKKPMKRNNSVLLPKLRRKSEQQQSPLRNLGGSSISNNSRNEYPPPLPQHHPSVERRRKDSNHTMYNSDDSASIASYTSSNYRTKSDISRRVDSGFESTHEDRYSSSSSTGRNSAKSFKAGRYSPPPVPPIPKEHSSEEFDFASSYGDFDQELDQVYGSLNSMTMQDRDKDQIRSRLNSNASSVPHSIDRRESETSANSSNRIRPSASTSTISSKYSDHQGRIKIKLHYKDTRILLVPNTVMFDELKLRIREKIGAPPSLRLQYKDEDDEMVLMIDDDDLIMARQISKSQISENGGIEKMELWCVNF